MDHRCLYGHRTPASFGFAIESGSCPVCGAPLVSVVGYQTARDLAADVPMDPVLAFNTVQYLEQHYDMSPKGDVEEEPAEVSVAEIEIDESEAEVTQTGPDQSEAEVVEFVETKPPIALVEAPAPAVELPSETAAPQPIALADKPVEDSLSDVERDFFA
ncbi:MAG: hypothetical protein GY913_18025 [Proteobacteria bacterium]|nr:hypothetical protein [Pseudomonadota bacterium]MCP4918806.1 hypothetical protein [Pseudomonadota bacterium]